MVLVGCPWDAWRPTVCIALVRGQRYEGTIMVVVVGGACDASFKHDNMPVSGNAVRLQYGVDIIIE